MSYSNDLLQYLWLAFSIVYCSLQVIAAILLFRERGLAVSIMLAGSILYGVAVLGSRLILVLSNAGIFELNPTNMMRNFNILNTVSALGGLLFIVGLILYALRRRALSARIAELEQILASQNSRLQ